MHAPGLISVSGGIPTARAIDEPRDTGTDSIFGALVELAGPAMLLVCEQRVVAASSAARALLDSGDQASIIGRLWPDDLIAAIDLDRLAQASRFADGVPILARMANRDALRQLLVAIRPLPGEPVGRSVVSMLEMTGADDAQRRRDWLADMHEQTEILCLSGSIERDFIADRVDLSPGMGALLGYRRVARQRTWAEAMQAIPEDERAHVDSIWSNARPGEPFEFQHRMLHQDGSRRIVLERGVVHAGPDGSPERGVAVVQDITAQRDAELRIEELRSKHEVTGLANRAALLDRLDEAVQASRWNPCHVAVLVVEIDQVEMLAESIGFGASDTMSMAIAARLSEHAPEGWMLAHIGEGEFALTLRQREPFEQTQLICVATQVREIISRPILIGRNEVQPTLSIGIACYPEDASGAAALVECAQTARGSADDSALGKIAFFRREIGEANLRRLDIESALRRAIANGDEFSLAYQPMLDLGTGKIHGVEALLRWQSPTLGTVSPAEFIGIAEKSDLILGIGEWVIRAALEQSARWAHGPLSKMRTWINLSAQEIRRADFAEFVQKAIIASGAAPSRIGFDIGEGAIDAHIDSAASKLKTLHATGIQFALDDFGTGVSSLSLLRTLPIDLIKVDRSYINDVTASLEEVSLTRAIIRLTHSLQLKVVAEGVENDSQLGMLIADSCDYAQGRVFSGPVDVATLEAMVGEGKCLPDTILRRPDRQQTLLLVDDEANILASLRRLLRREGYRILTAESAAEGLVRLAENEVDVIVSDQRMPGMTGVEFLRKAKELYPETIRLVLSGYTELQSITDAVNEGAIYKFLTKPWDDERLVTHIREAFDQKRLADENRRLNDEVHAAYLELAQAKGQVEALLESEKRRNVFEEARATTSHVMLDAMPVALLGLDPSGLLVYMNNEAERLLPQAQASIGLDASQILPPEILDALRANPAGGARSTAVGGSRLLIASRPFGESVEPRGILLTLTPMESIET